MWVKQWRGRCCPATATFLHQIIIGMFFISIILIVNMIIIVSCLFLYAWMAALIEKKLRCSRKKSGRLRDVFPKKTGKCWNFSQVEDWVWHAKNHLVKLQKKWDLGRPPPSYFFKIPTFPVFLGDVPKHFVFAYLCNIVIVYFTFDTRECRFQYPWIPCFSKI